MSEQTANRPNVLYINCHDAGRYIQPYGAPVETPHLQRFAADAAVFRHAFCVNPTCSPSRAALLTGTHPHQNGMCGLAHLGWRLRDYGEHWHHALRAAGYTSYFCGGQHIGPTERIGYDHVLEAFGQEAHAHRVAELLHSGRTEEPFYLEIGFGACHRIGQAMPEPDPEDDPRFVSVPPALPDEPRVRREFAGYRTLARQMDRLMGTVLDALERSGHAEDTLVICTTDHGIDFPRMKCTLRDDGLDVFLMLRGPRSGPGSELRGGKLVEPMVTHLDVFPTLCDVCGIEKPKRLEGASLLPLVRGETERLHDAVFGEVNYHAAYQPMRSVRTDRYKYIRRFYERPTPVKPNEAPNPTRDVLEEHGWAEQIEPREALYDLVHDPNEAHNRIEEPSYAEVARELRDRLERWMEETEDPIRHGHIELPEGGRIQPMDGASNQGKGYDAEAWNAALRAEGA